MTVPDVFAREANGCTAWMAKCGRTVWPLPNRPR